MAEPESDLRSATMAVLTALAHNDHEAAELVAVDFGWKAIAETMATMILVILEEGLEPPTGSITEKLALLGLGLAEAEAAIEAGLEPELDLGLDDDDTDEL